MTTGIVNEELIMKNLLPPQSGTHSTVAVSAASPHSAVSTMAVAAADSRAPRYGGFDLDDYEW